MPWKQSFLAKMLSESRYGKSLIFQLIPDLIAFKMNDSLIENHAKSLNEKGIHCAVLRCHADEDNSDSTDNDNEFGRGQEDVSLLINRNTRFVFAHPEAIVASRPSRDGRSFSEVRFFRPKWSPVLLMRHIVLKIGEYL